MEQLVRTHLLFFFPLSRIFLKIHIYWIPTGEIHIYWIPTGEKIEIFRIDQKFLTWMAIDDNVDFINNPLLLSKRGIRGIDLMWELDD